MSQEKEAEGIFYEVCKVGICLSQIDVCVCGAGLMVVLRNRW